MANPILDSETPSLKANHKQANQYIIQANLSDIQANWSDT